MVTQRVIGIALGYEDLIDHDGLRHDPVLAVLAGKLEAHRSDCAPLAGKSTLNRLELSRPEPTRYHKVSHDPAAIETLFVDLFLAAQRRTPEQIILDLDATDDPRFCQVWRHRNKFSNFLACIALSAPDSDRTRARMYRRNYSFRRLWREP
jgi:hypothetical protein